VRRIGRAFYRAATAGGVEGTGLGLAGAQEVVRQHGGRLRLESRVGAGTTVTVVLPAEPRRHAAGAVHS
jgi:signal transduction histidine kinase